MTADSRAACITGLGVIAPNGVGREAFTAALAAGRSGIGDIVSFDPQHTGRERAAEIHDFDETPFLRSPKNYLDRNSALALAACEMAVRESSAPLPGALETTGVAFGSAAGNLHSLALFHQKVAEKGPRLAPPFLFPHAYHNTTPALLAIEYGLGGPHACFCSGGVSGLQAIACAADEVARQRADLMVAGGADAFSEPLFRAALAQGWLSPAGSGEESCRPYSRRRNGTILGEGAGVFVIESLAHAQARGALVLACVVGYGAGASPHDAMTHALAAARAQPEDVVAVYAAAAGLVKEDEQEARAVRAVFGRRAVPVVPMKALIGETLGAGGPLSLAAAIVALNTNALPPLPEEQDCAFESLDLVAAPRSMVAGTILVNACALAATSWASLAVALPLRRNRPVV